MLSLVQMVKRIHKISFYALLLTVYAVFFSVQFFFNFDGPEPGNGQTILRYSHSVHPAATGTSFAKNNFRHSSSPTHNVRLNKRFHQENIPPYDVLSMEKPEQFVIRRTLGHYLEPFLPSFTLVDLPLRGPPFAA
jgi:hypothetical protein